jgi:hypothetical protein
MTPSRTLFDRADVDSGWQIEGELDELALTDQAGRPFVIARVPRIARQFSSPMHTLAGMTPRLGTWRDELAAFLAGQLPSARLREDTSLDTERSALRRAVVSAIEEGFAGSLKVDADGEVYGYLARPDRIASTIDIAALAADYGAWFEAAGIELLAPEDVAYVNEQLTFAVEDLRESCYSTYLHCLGEKRAGYAPVQGAIVDGIVVGDDPAQTCAFLLRDLSGDQRLWESVR